MCDYYCFQYVYITNIYSVDQPIVDNWKVRRGRFVDVVIIVSDK